MLRRVRLKSDVLRKTPGQTCAEVKNVPRDSRALVHVRIRVNGDMQVRAHARAHGHPHPRHHLRLITVITITHLKQ